MAAFSNNLQTCFASNKLCKAFSIRISSSTQIVLLARNAGFDSLFIDTEHGWLTLGEVSNICTAALLAGITPFVRVPHQCGNGFVQRVLDGGAMGVIFPHIHSADDAKAAVRISKYPPQGVRSMTGIHPVLGLKPTPVEQTMKVCNESTSTVIAMIESKDAIEAIESIAAVDGVDVLLVGSSDLSIDLGVPGQFHSEAYRSALDKVSRACRKNNKILGLAGVYDQHDIQDWIINTLGARFMLVAQDASLIASGAPKTIQVLPAVKG